MQIEKLINHSGKHVRCIIQGIIIDDCILHYQCDRIHHRFYLCQNYKDGADSENKHGYLYSWTFVVRKNNEYTSADDELKLSLSSEYIKDLELL